MDLTVLLPCLNETETLEVCIKKAKRQIKKLKIKAEIIVADNGSIDGSIKIAKKLTNNNLNIENQIVIKKIFIIYLIGILIWFLKSPDYRFGAGIIVGLIGLFFSNILSKYIIKKNSNKTLMTILFLCIVFFTLKNSNRIFLTTKTYNNSPWPKYFSHGEQNILPSYQKIDIDGKNIYISENYCMYGPSPCSSVSFDLSIKKIWILFFF